MLSSTVELITILASSSSPSLLAFCFSHLIIAVLLLGGRREWTPKTAEAETVDDIRVQERKRSGRGRETPATADGVVEHRHSYAHEHEVDGRPKGCVADVGTDDVQVKASEKSSGAEDDMVQQKCGDGEVVEDELITRAEEFIRRMNRVWMAENVRFC